VHRTPVLEKTWTVCRVNEDEGLEKGNVGRGKERSVVPKKANSGQNTPSEHQQMRVKKTADPYSYCNF
jgi:hypothetical protein